MFANGPILIGGKAKSLHPFLPAADDTLMLIVANPLGIA
jgi:hypothetical protein